MRENSRLIPWNGSEIAHQTIASDTRSVASGVELAALVDEPRDRLGEHRHHHRARDQQQAIWRTPLAIVRRRSSRAPRAAKRASVGNRIVAIEIENSPCGSR